MQKSEKFFIFSWKELLVLALVSITAMGFFFTLGLHYGKQLHVEVKGEEAPVPALESGGEVLPPKDALEAGAHQVESASAQAIQGATEKAMEETGLKADHPKPVELPAQKIGAPAAGEAKAPEPESDASTETETLPSFAIQLGSYPSNKEAQKRVSVFTKRGLKTEIRTAKVGGETRHRVIMPGFVSKKLAEQKGREMKSARKIENFVVIKSE